MIKIDIHSLKSSFHFLIVDGKMLKIMSQCQKNFDSESWKKMNKQI